MGDGGVFINWTMGPCQGPGQCGKSLAKRSVAGHTNRQSAEKFWALVGADAWPKELTCIMAEEHRWPKHKPLAGAPQETFNSVKLTRVSGLKYSMQGGFQYGQK